MSKSEEAPQPRPVQSPVVEPPMPVPVMTRAIWARYIGVTVVELERMIAQAQE